jgi:hypothetical protein
LNSQTISKQQLKFAKGFENTKQKRFLQKKKFGSQKFPILVSNFQYEFLEHGEDKNVINGLNNKLIKILQEDGLICCMNKAKILVRPNGMKMYYSETPQVETTSR